MLQAHAQKDARNYVLLKDLSRILHATHHSNNNEIGRYHRSSPHFEARPPRTHLQNANAVLVFILLGAWFGGRVQVRRQIVCLSAYGTVHGERLLRHQR